MATRRSFAISYALIVGLGSLIALEGGVRLLGLAPPLPEQYSVNVADPFVPWRKIPNSVAEGRTEEFAFSYRHNGAGFRDLERSTEKPAGVYRILALGDSFTYGVGAAFEETFPRRLEHQLNTVLGGGPPVEVVNAGIPGYWPEAERLMLEHHGLAYSPDLVLVAFLPNDVVDTHRGGPQIDVATGFLVQRARGGTETPFAWLFARSHLFRGLHASSSRVRGWAAGLGRARPIEDVDQDGAARDAAWVRIEQEYTRMAALASARAARMALVFLPQKGPWKPDSGDDSERRLARWAAAHGALFIDTKPALRAAWESAPLYYPIDGHCTPAGYAVIARTIAAALLASPLFDRTPGDGSRAPIPAGASSP
jgi:lysophospholipase L1-like esterase